MPNQQLLDLELQRDGRGVILPMHKQPLLEMTFVPVIINIQPVANLPLLLGLAEIPPDYSVATIQKRILRTGRKNRSQ